jgi:hypothetical protein
MSEQKMLEKYCNATMKSILERYKRNDDFEINDLLGFVFGNASFFMDKTMSERYYLTALDLAEENVVKKISVLEKLADLYVDSDVDKNVVSDMVNEINKYRKQYGFNHNYGNDFILGKLGTYFGQNGNFYYIKAERGLKNEKTRLFKLYSHLSNFYADIDVNLAKKYKEKAVRLSEQLYKYGSRDIDYARSLLVRPTA